MLASQQPCFKGGESSLPDARGLAACNLMTGKTGAGYVEHCEKFSILEVITQPKHAS
jgi:hypothetical protein